MGVEQSLVGQYEDYQEHVLDDLNEKARRKLRSWRKNPRRPPSSPQSPSSTLIVGRVCPSSSRLVKICPSDMRVSSITCATKNRLPFIFKAGSRAPLFCRRSGAPSRPRTKITNPIRCNFLKAGIIAWEC